MNGIAERTNRTLLDGVRALILSSGLSSVWWAELLRTVCYLRNKTLHKSLNGAVPDELWYGRSPMVGHLKAIGSLCFVHLDKSKRHKLEARAKLGIMLGYATRTRGYRIWLPDTDQIVETKNVRFNESKKGMEVMRNANKRYVHFESSFWQHSPDRLTTEVPIRPERKRVQSSERETSVKPKQGWQRQVIIRKKGKTAGQSDIYFVHSSSGRRLRSRREVQEFCANQNLPYEPKKFDFNRKNLYSGQIEPNSEEESDHHNNSDRSDDEDSSDSSSNESTGTVIEAHCMEVEIPESFNQAMSSPQSYKWKQAMDEELDTLKERHVYDIVPKPQDQKVIGSKWVYALKHDQHGVITSYKARLVAQGYKQNPGIDYHSTFSPVVNFSLIRFFFVLLVVTLGWISSHVDIKCAFLYGTLHENVYMYPAPGSSNIKGSVWKLRKALYELHQASHQWYIELDKTFVDLGFQKLQSCNCVYLYKKIAVLLVYVDDILIFGKTKDIIREIVDKISSKFAIKELGKLRNCLGVEFEYSNGQIFIHQKKYIEYLAKRFNVNTAIPVFIPLEPGINLTRDDCPVREPDKSDMSRFPYRALIGCLMFLALKTRPDILYIVTALSQFNSNPGKCHWVYLCKVLAYVVTSKDLKINLTTSKNNSLQFYSDSSWASDLDDRKSFGGFVTLLNGTPITWHVQKQKSIALSSMEAEFITLSEVVKEVLWLTYIIEECGWLPVKGPFPVYCDNQAAIAYAENMYERMRSKHIDLRYKFVRANMAEGKFKLKYISSKNNLADIFTKVLVKKTFLELRNALLSY